jgi:hypothetical protein
MLKKKPLKTLVLSRETLGLVGGGQVPTHGYTEEWTDTFWTITCLSDCQCITQPR